MAGSRNCTAAVAHSTARPQEPAPGALGYVLAELAASHWRLTAKIGAHQLACELLGFNGKDALATAMNQAAGNRAQVIALSLILRAFEDFMTTDTWRNPTPRTATT